MKEKKRRGDDANEGGVATGEKLKGKAYEADAAVKLWHPGHPAE